MDAFDLAMNIILLMESADHSFESMTSLLSNLIDRPQKHFFDSFAASAFFFFASHHLPFLSFSQNFHGRQNILLYEYLNIQYIHTTICQHVKRKNRVSAFKQTNKMKN